MIFLYLYLLWRENLHGPLLCVDFECFWRFWHWSSTVISESPEVLKTPRRELENAGKREMEALKQGAQEDTEEARDILWKQIAPNTIPYNLYNTIMIRNAYSYCL